MIPSFSYEITFTIDNENKVLENEDNLNVRFFANHLVSHEDTYYINI